MENKLEFKSTDITTYTWDKFEADELRDYNWSQYEAIPQYDYNYEWEKRSLIDNTKHFWAKYTTEKEYSDFNEYEKYKVDRYKYTWWKVPAQNPYKWDVYNTDYADYRWELHQAHIDLIADVYELGNGPDIISAKMYRNGFDMGREQIKYIAFGKMDRSKVAHTEDFYLTYYHPWCSDYVSIPSGAQYYDYSLESQNNGMAIPYQAVEVDDTVISDEGEYSKIICYGIYPRGILTSIQAMLFTHSYHPVHGMFVCDENGNKLSSIDYRKKYKMINDARANFGPVSIGDFWDISDSNKLGLFESSYS